MTCKGIIYQCLKCGINARNKYNLTIHLQKHERIAEQKEMLRMGMTKCQWCSKTLKDMKSLKKHKCLAVKKWKECNEKDIKQNEFRCSKCFSTFSRRDLLNSHKMYCFATIHKFNRHQGLVKCHKCDHVVRTWKDLWQHQREKHQRGGGTNFHSSPYSEQNPPPWEDQEGKLISPDLKEIYEKYKQVFLGPDQEGDVLRFYNQPITNDVTTSDIMQKVVWIYKNQKFAFKFNFSFGIILQHQETKKYKFFYAHSNASFLIHPFTFSELKDIQRFRKRIEGLDVMEHIKNVRDSTKWIPILLCNIRYAITLTNFVLGCGDLPHYITKKSV